MNKPQIKILGLGPGEFDRISVRVLEEIEHAQPLYVRTLDHPAVEQLIADGYPVESFDHIYEDCGEDFDEVYRRIVSRLLEELSVGTVHYAVPGHPLVAEKTVQLLLEAVPEQVEIVGGQSFLDDLFTAVQVDPVAGFELLDAFTLTASELNPTHHVFVMQVAHSLIAGHVKLELMARYPDEHPVYLVKNAGTSAEVVEKLPLYELDYFDEVNNLQTLYVPPLSGDANTRSFATLVNYLGDIFAPGGDVWARNQTAADLLPYFHEELGEYEEALATGDPAAQVEELGDLLLQVVYQASVLEEEWGYSIWDVLERLNRKIRFRHPHVFDGVKAETIEEVDAIWQEQKRKEREQEEERRCE